MKMDDLLSRSWWVLALRGAIAIVFGVAALSMPGVSLLALLVLFAVYALVGGAASIAGALRLRKSHEDWWLPFLLGIAAICAGIVAIVRPGLTLFVLVLLIGANALVGGVLDLIMAIRLRKVLRHEWLLMLSAVVSIAFGVLVFLMPVAGALAVAMLIGFYAMLTGVLLFGAALRLRSSGIGERRAVTDRRSGIDRRAMPAH
jgi:uncharacterized membrane protein HdeD (DUF308 family)